MNKEYKKIKKDVVEEKDTDTGHIRILKKKQIENKLSLNKDRKKEIIQKIKNLENINNKF